MAEILRALDFNAVHSGDAIARVYFDQAAAAIRKAEAEAGYWRRRPANPGSHRPRNPENGSGARCDLRTSRSMTPQGTLPMTIDVAELRRLHESACAELRSRGGSHRLLFSLCHGGGWITTSSENVVRAVNSVWNAAPALLDTLASQQARIEALETVHRLALQVCNQNLRGEDGNLDTTILMLDDALKDASLSAPGCGIGRTQP